MNNSNIVILVLLFIGSAFFSASETAYNSASRIKLKNMASIGDKKAERVLDLTENYTKLISTILIGNNIVNIAAASIFTVICIKVFGEIDGPAYSTLISTLIVLIFGEVLPKTIAKMIPEKFAISTLWILSFLVTLLTPVTFLFGLLEKGVIKVFGVDYDDSISSEELLTMVEEAADDGELNEAEADLVSNAIEFNDLDVRDILTPRVDLIALSIDTPPAEIEKAFRENNYSRIPIYEKTIDNITGILHDKDFYYAYYRSDDAIEVSKIMKDVLFTSPHVKISSLLRELQKEKCHMAIVIDEYGGTEGVITMEDILEELVGEIYDEHDEVEESIRKVSDNDYIVKGDLEIKDLFEVFDLKLPEDYDFVTTSGWVIHNLDKMADKGDTFTYENLKVLVVDCDEKIVNKIKITVLKEDEESKD